MTNLLDQADAEILAALNMKTTPGHELVENETLIIERHPGRTVILIYRGGTWDGEDLEADWDFVGQVLVGEGGLYLACLECRAAISVGEAAMCMPCREDSALNDAAEADAHQRDYEDGEDYL